MNRPPNAYDLPEDDSGWQPGDPIHAEASRSSGHYQHRALYNFRDEPDAYLDDCYCPDSASWPNPKPSAVLRGEDEIEQLIALTHQDARRAELNGDDAA